MKQTLKIIASLSLVLIGASMSFSAWANDNGNSVGFGLASRQLGQGYSSDRGMPAANCLNRASIKYSTLFPIGVQYTNKWISVADFKKMFERNLINFSKTYYKLFHVNVIGNFTNLLTASERSEAMVYLTLFRTRSATYVAPTSPPLLNYVGEQYVKSPQLFRQFCGDKYYSHFELGGALAYAVAFTFGNVQDKATFDARVNASVPMSLANLSATLGVDVQGLATGGAVSIIALQLGGNSRYLGQVMGVPQQGETLPITTCSFSNVTACQAMIKNLITYAKGTGPTDYPQQFPKQLDPQKIETSEAILAATKTPYSSLSPSIQTGTAVLSSSMQSARSYLVGLLKTDQDNQSLATSVAAQIPSNDFNFQSLFSTYLAKAKYNRKLLNQAAHTCYFDLPNCVSAVTQLKANLLPLESTQMLTPPVVYNTGPLAFPTYHSSRLGDGQSIYVLGAFGAIDHVTGIPAAMTQARLVGASLNGTSYEAISNLFRPQNGSPGPRLADVVGQIIDNTPSLTGQQETWSRGVSDQILRPEGVTVQTQNWSLTLASDFNSPQFVTPALSVSAGTTTAQIALTGQPQFKDPQTTQFKVVLSNGTTDWCTPSNVSPGSTRTCDVSLANLSTNTAYTAKVTAYAGTVVVGQSEGNFMTKAEEK